MSILKIAAQLYTLRDFLKEPKQIKETLKKVSEIGYEHIQVSGMGEIDPNLLNEYANEYNLNICATHISSDKLLNNLDEVIAQHKLWDCKYVGIGSMPDEYRTSYEGYIEFAKIYGEVAKKVKYAGLQLIYHDHNFEFQKFNGKLGLQILVDEAPPELDFEIDTYWVQAGGANPIDWINKLNGRMQFIHFKDMSMLGNKQRMASIGAGNLDWDNIIKACYNTDVKYAAVEQDDCYGISPFDCLKDSLNFLKNKI